MDDKTVLEMVTLQKKQADTVTILMEGLSILGNTVGMLNESIVTLKEKKLSRMQGLKILIFGR